MSETRSFLDKQGLAYFWSKIQNEVQSEVNDFQLIENIFSVR